MPEDDQTPSPFIRAVSARNNVLLGQREALLTDLQVIDQRSSGDQGLTFSELVSLKLDELTGIDSKIDTIKKYFSPNEKPEESGT